MMEKHPEQNTNNRRKPSFRREITITLLVKLALLIAVKVLFFSNPVDKSTIATHMDSVFGNTQPPSPSTLSISKDSP